MAKAEREAAEGSDRSLASPTRCLQGKGVAIHRVAQKDLPKKVRRFMGAKVRLDENGRAGIDWGVYACLPRHPRELLAALGYESPLFLAVAIHMNFGVEPCRIIESACFDEREVPSQDWLKFEDGVISSL